MSEKERIIGYIKDEKIKIDPAIKEKWLTALRSGDYAQVEGWLNKNGCYCCLGVLAEINGIPKTANLVDSTGDTYYDFHFENGKDYNCTLPTGKFGLTGMVMSALAELNDDEGLTFAEIADIIEEHL